MREYTDYLKGLRTKALAGGAVLTVIGVLLWVYGRLHPGQDYSQVVVGGSLFVCGTVCVVLGEIANMFGGLAKVLRDQGEETEEKPT